MSALSKHRRTFLRLMACCTVAGGFGRAYPVAAAANRAPSPAMKAGDYHWYPERSPEGPVAIIVSIPDQLVHVYRNGVRIAISTCSTGKAGHATPTGIFTILQKDRNHHSSTYNNAPMPFMNRLTWSGVAIHAGNLPGYPASHGCVRLPLKFAELLFTVTHVGTPVIIAGGHSDPREIVHPALVLDDIAEHEMKSAVATFQKRPLPSQDHADNPTPPTTILISGADRRAFILENGERIAEGPVTIVDPSTPLGAHTFILQDAHSSPPALRWIAVGHHPDSQEPVIDPEAATLMRVRPDEKVNVAIRARMHPGMTLTITDLPASSDTRSQTGFLIMAPHDEG